MDRQAIREEIELNLTGDVVDLDITDTTVDKIINMSFREIQRYIDSTRLITIPFNGCIDMKPYKVSSVSRVFRTVGYTSDNTEDNYQSGTVDPMLASQWQLLSGVGNLANMTDFVQNYASWNTLLQIRNTTSTDLLFRYDKDSEKLYVNISSNRPDRITVEYVPRYEDVAEITSDFWIDMLIKLAVANTKVIVGRVRSKYTQSNALWVIDGPTLLQEGKAELDDLREKMRIASQLTYPID